MYLQILINVSHLENVIFQLTRASNIQDVFFRNNAELIYNVNVTPTLPLGPNIISLSMMEKKDFGHKKKIFKIVRHKHTTATKHYHTFLYSSPEIKKLITSSRKTFEFFVKT